MAPAFVPGAYPGAGPGAIVPTKIDFTQVFSRTWAIFTRKWATGLLAMLLVGVVMALGIGAMMVVVFGLATAGQEMLVLAVLLAIVLGLGVSLAAVWLWIGLTIFFLRDSNKTTVFWFAQCC